MGYWDTWRDMLLRDARRKSVANRAAARNVAGALNRGGTVSGALRGANESLAAQEAVDQAGINLVAEQNIAAEERAEAERRKAEEEAKKAQKKNAIWGAVTGLAKTASQIFLPALASKLVDKGADAAAGQAAPTAPPKPMDLTPPQPGPAMNPYEAILQNMLRLKRKKEQTPFGSEDELRDWYGYLRQRAVMRGE